MHQSVLLQEAIEALNIKPDGIYVDGTFGRGGHTMALLHHMNDDGRVLVIDKDQTAIEHARAQFARDSRVFIMQGSFADVVDMTQSLGICGRINGVLLDLGVSSPQLDDAQRGFSFMHDGPLDMRMDQTKGFNAADFVNHAKAEEMALVFKEYGEERFAGRIAKAIVAARLEAPIMNTKRLAEIVKVANPKWEKHKHPATRVFQAIRIHVNQELNDLKKGLPACVSVLAKGGRLVVISFHSLEDRIVKHFMRDEETGVVLPRSVPVRASDTKTHFKRIGKAVKPKILELSENERCRSAVLRIGEKIA